MATNARTEHKAIDHDLLAKAIARAVIDGDIVNFRFIFTPLSPARQESPEAFEDRKYAYLQPDAETEADPAFRDVLAMVREPETWRHILGELDARRPARLPAPLLLRLADQAVRGGKYTAAAQAYEQLRLRARMQQLFLDEARDALAAGDVPRAVIGYRIATGLEYNYAAFPEPLPVVPDYQRRALMMHGDYPERPEDSIPMQEPATFLRTALEYLLLNPEAAAQIEQTADATVRVEFLVQLVHAVDPQWPAFAERYRETCGLMREFQERIEHAIAQRGQSRGLADEIEDTLGADPDQLPARLLGRELGKAEWWQYLKELASAHPPAALFVARQAIGAREIIVPRYRSDGPLPERLGLLPSP